jgi:hypothetical protein
MLTVSTTKPKVILVSFAIIFQKVISSFFSAKEKISSKKVRIVLIFCLLIILETCF